MKNFYNQTKLLTGTAKSSLSELKKVQEKITSAASIGLSSCIIVGHISNDVLTSLRDGGFTLEPFSESGQRFGYKISW